MFHFSLRHRVLVRGFAGCGRRQRCAAARSSATTASCRVPTTRSTTSRARSASGRSPYRPASRRHSSSSPSRYEPASRHSYTWGEVTSQDLWSRYDGHFVGMKCRNGGDKGRRSIMLHTYIHPLNGPLSGTTRVSRYQKGKTNLDFTEARDSEWQWHQLGHMQACTSLQTDNHANTLSLSFLQAGCPSCRPTNSVRAPKAWRSIMLFRWNSPSLFKEVSMWSITYQQSPLSRYYCSKHLWELCPQDGAENQLV